MSTFQEVAVTSCLKDPAISAYVWDVDSGTTLTTYRGDHQVSEKGLSMLQGEYMMAALQDKPFLRVWPVNSQQPLNSLRLVCPGRANLAQVSPDGCYIAVTVSKKLHIYQIASGRLIGSGERHFQPIQVVRWTQGGEEVVCGGEDGIITVWPLCKFVPSESTPQPRLVFSDHVLSVTDLTLSHGSRSRIYSASLDRTCKIYDLVGGVLLLNLVFDTPLTSLAVPTLETELFVGSVKGKVYQMSLLSPPRQIEYHVTSDKEVPVFNGHTAAVNCLAVANSGQLLMSGSLDGNVKLWHVSSRVCVRTLTHKGPISNAFFTLKPKQMFANELKPSVILAPFQTANNEASNIIEVITKQTLTLCDDFDEELFPRETNDASDAKSKALQSEVDSLRSINSNLYKFVVEKLIEKDTHQPPSTEIETIHRLSQKKKHNSTLNNQPVPVPAVNGVAKKKKNRKRKRKNSAV